MLCMMTLNIERNGNTLAVAKPAVTKLVWSPSLLPVWGTQVASQGLNPLTVSLLMLSVSGVLAGEGYVLKWPFLLPY